VGGGFAEVQPKQVIILADSAEQADEIDLDRAQQARESALKAMEEGVTEDSPMRYMEIQRSLQKARIRIDVSRRRTGRRPRSIPGAPRQSEE
jgi:F-type H+-transporting ATPase subunit epsilon